MPWEGDSRLTRASIDDPISPQAVHAQKPLVQRSWPRTYSRSAIAS